MSEFGYIYLREHESYDKYNCYKMGKASNIPERENVYVTGEIKRGKFILVIEVDKNEMDNIELKLKDYFHDINVYIDGGNEFFEKKILEKIPAYLLNNNFNYKILGDIEIGKLQREYREKNAIDKCIQDKYNNINNKLEQNNLIITKKPFPYQIEIIDISHKYFLNNNKGILVIPCGTGKTLISIWITQKINKTDKILIGVPNIELLEQWENDISQEFNKHKVLKVQSGMSIDKIKSIFEQNQIIISFNFNLSKF